MKRRTFIKTSVASAGFTLVNRNVLGGIGYVPPSDKITVGFIGTGTQGIRHLMKHISHPEIKIVAVCDPNADSMDYVEWADGELRSKIRHFLDDDMWGEGMKGCRAGRELGKELVNAYYARELGKKDYDGCRTYTDYRELLERETDLDAVYIMTPDHNHAPVAIRAMRKGKHAIVHKPLATTVEESRLVAETARQAKVATHMFCDESLHTTPLLCEWIWDGAIGHVREVHNWSTRPFWPQGMSRYPVDTPPVPEGLNWDLWLGPAEYRPYHPDYTHAVFRGWKDFGTGALGDMGHYSFRQIFQILKLDLPQSVEASRNVVFEIEDNLWIRKESQISFPNASIIHFGFPELSDMPPVSLHWYDGALRPPIPKELEKDGRRMPEEGLLFVGDKGKILAEFEGGSPRLIPESQMQAYVRPAQTLERPDDGFNQWVNACKCGDPSSASFEEVAKLTETVCLGNIALRFDEKLNWDAANGSFTNSPEANALLKREIREEFSVY
jgi:predicted dehydrogenase